VIDADRLALPELLAEISVELEPEEDAPPVDSVDFADSSPDEDCFFVGLGVEGVVGTCSFSDGAPSGDEFSVDGAS